MAFGVTTATKKLWPLDKRIKGVAGGTSASKTISILMILITKAEMDTRPTITSVVSESFPHLSRGAIRDFLAIMQDSGHYEDSRWNKTASTYFFPTGSRIEFFSADQPGKVRGPRRDRLFINEANNVPYETFDQLEIRTKEEIWLDWNPTNEFWFYNNILPARDDVDFVTLTYLDNEGLDPQIIKSIESHRENKNWWLVYGLGQLGEVEGKIYTGWNIIDSVPHEARLERRGLDFGYANDPSALVDIYRYNDSFIWDELLYVKGFSNARIADFIKELPVCTLVADSAEPKSIDELKSYGLSVLPAQKGPGSVSQGISYVQDQKISMTKRSVNLIKEYRNYMWRYDRDGIMLSPPVPEGGLDHLLDAGRYASESLRHKPKQYRQKKGNLSFAVPGAF